MENFQPGDKVEFIDDNSSGTVVSVIDQKKVLIDLDGIEIPVLKSQLIKVSGSNTEVKNLAEKYKDDLTENQGQTKITGRTNKGIFLSLANANRPELFDLELINDSYHHIHFTFYSEQNRQLHALKHGQLQAFSNHHLIQVNQTASTKFPTYHLFILRFVEEGNSLPEVIQYSFTPTGKDLMRKQEKAPLLNYPCWLFKVESPKKDLTQIELSDSKKEDHFDFDEASNIIDLHIDKIEDNPDLLDRNEILKIQFNYFLKEFEKAVAQNFETIIIIHGIGVNTLKDKIRKYLKGNKYVIAIKDANVRDYGYGATEIQLIV
jgi:hypothetical protein